MTVKAPTHAELTVQVAALTDQLEVVTEAAIDAQRMLDAEDRGWLTVGGSQGEVIDRDAIMSVAAVAQVHAIADPLIKRAVNLRVAYLGAPSMAARSDGDQDVNAVIQAFLDDEANAQVISDAQAAAKREIARETGGNTFHALPTSPLTGRVQIRTVPAREITSIVTNPEDAVDVWLYRREWTATVLEQGHTGLTRSRRETRRAYYPDVRHRPATRPRTIDGLPVHWDTPIIHTRVNTPEGSQWGVPDVLAALPWAKGYKAALEDWARHNKALAAIAYKASVKGRRGAAAVRDRMPTGDTVGGTVVHGEGQVFEAVSKSGAALDSSAAKPLAGMVASSMDVPLTMLLSDPGTTGARAVAETLDRPLELAILARRAVDTTFLTTVLRHVIREAVRAPRGPLRGTVTRDPDTGREIVTLTSGQEYGISVDWPDLSTLTLDTLVDALAKVDGMDVVDPLVLARLVLVALGVDNVDEELEKVTDDDGHFVPPSARTALAAQSAGYDGAGRDQD